jgi:Peptidase C1-like family
VYRESILANEAVWFGCEILKRYVAKQGFLDQKVINILSGKRQYLVLVEQLANGCGNQTFTEAANINWKLHC